MPLSGDITGKPYPPAFGCPLSARLSHTLHNSFRARHNLGFMDKEGGRPQRALRHFLISVSMGYENSLLEVRQLFMHGVATKDDYQNALLGFQAAVKERESPQRTKAQEFLTSQGMLDSTPPIQFY